MKTNNIFSIEEFKTNIRRNSRLLGIDLGKKRIGVAICDDKRIIATPYKTIIKENFEQFLSELINCARFGGSLFNNDIDCLEFIAGNLMMFSGILCFKHNLLIFSSAFNLIFE